MAPTFKDFKEIVKEIVKENTKQFGKLDKVRESYRSYTETLTNAFIQLLSTTPLRELTSDKFHKKIHYIKREIQRRISE